MIRIHTESGRRSMPSVEEPLSILFASSEVVGYAKTGGLADVCGYLPRALSKRGHRCAAIMPLYRSAHMGKTPVRPTEIILTVPINGTVVPTRLWKTLLPDSEVPLYFVENQSLFERDDPHQGRGLYHHTLPDGRKTDYFDNGERFTFFCRAVMEAIPHLGLPYDVLHANDWQTGLLPVYLRELYQHRQAFRSMRSLYTIHNIAYQGVFPHSAYAMTGLDPRLFNPHQLEFYGQFSFLKAGVVFADWVNTVSPTYAQEVRTPYYGCGLEGVLTERRDRLNGIVNGVDYDSWNPATDPLLPARYDATSFEVGKPVCKAELQRRMGLPDAPRVPVLGMIARLVDQKGIDLVVKMMPELFEQPVQIVILGDGDPQYHAQLDQLRRRYPDKLGLYLGFDESLAHLIEAGSDLYLMPSLFEPSGLNQLYSLQYGTPPIVRATGGLSDTISDTTDARLADRSATGFRFLAYTPQALLGAIRRAIGMYEAEPEKFAEVVRNGMRQDWSWNRAAQGYEDLYRRLSRERRAERTAG